MHGYTSIKKNQYQFGYIMFNYQYAAQSNQIDPIIPVQTDPQFTGVKLLELSTLSISSAA